MKEEFDILNKIKKEGNKSGFDVPEGYFDSLEDKIMENIIAEEQPLRKKIIMVAKPWLSLAAIFILAALVYYNVPYFMKDQTQTAQIVTVDQDISLDYLASNFEESDIVDFLLEEDNAPIFDDFNENKELLEGLSIEDVEDLVIF